MKTGVMDAAYFEQLRRAGEMMQRRHERLLALGFQWDGQDGYCTDDPKAWAAMMKETASDGL